ncbi:hypothetical protein TrVE_jg5944 [Triparma verrucosa]|uniref:Uncharacterized protein n=1 Tax=Triparma verrucosa TaxID=1606542 RepID=A0A9W7EP26_9STRA|nr:hypothetical protein TrVE_jg5944 [Triparma verrucosa]
MSEPRPLTLAQHVDDHAHNSAQGTVDPKTNREPTQQQATSPPLPSPSPPVASAGPSNSQHDLQGGQEHPSTLHRTIHEEPEALFEALLGDQTELSKMLYQKNVEEGVFYWSFMFEGTKSCDLLLRMLVEKDDEEGVVISVESVNDEELEATPLPNPHSTASKKLKLILTEGTIVLQPLQFGQTLFTFTAQVDVGEVTKDASRSSFRKSRISFRKSRSSFRKSRISPIRSATTAGIASAITGVTSSAGAAAKKFGAGGEADKANKLFCQLADLFYERFKKEHVIDERRKEDFIENRIPNAPPLTEDEQNMIAKLMGEVEVMKAKRIAGTVNEPVEKFLHRDEKGGAAWGMSVARMEVAAITLFTELFLLNTYAKWAEHKKTAIREVWENIDGTRSVEYIGSLSLPGVQDRIFHIWMTWKRLMGEDGRETFIIALSPFVEYRGETCHEVEGAEKLYDAATKGVHIVKQLTKNTCEWTHVQQADLKILNLPEYLVNYIAKQQLGKANELQEKFRRNGKEVDREKVAALADVDDL